MLGLRACVGLSISELTVATEVEAGRPMIWRWQQRFADAGPDGLLRDRR
jgi:hypothetical protein